MSGAHKREAATAPAATGALRVCLLNFSLLFSPRRRLLALRSIRTRAMPLLHRKPFAREKPPADLRPDEHVFYCKVTNEIFRDYE